MAQKHPHTDHGGPGNSTPGRKSLRESGGQDKTAQHRRNPGHSAVSGGGGEQDSHHTHNSRTK